jgi:hypothetical protein
MAANYPDMIKTRTSVDWDFFSVVPEIAHHHGIKAYLYVSIFDEGFPLAPPEVRATSYHNAMHGQHITWQSEFSQQHPEFALVDQSGVKRQWGVLCLAYPEVRAQFRKRFGRWLRRGDWDGLFVCLRSQSKPAEFADQYGFNSPVLQDYLERHGVDILEEDFDLGSWRDLRGEYLNRTIEDLRDMTDALGVRLALGLPRGDILGPPLDNRTLDWRSWVQRGFVDELVINQNSSRCPSMWHDLWPMHRGVGYLQNYLDSFNLPPIIKHLNKDYAPVFEGSQVRLYIARQWDHRSSEEEQILVNHPTVSGLVFSSFRFDNPAAVSRGDWVA